MRKQFSAKVSMQGAAWKTVNHQDSLPRLCHQYSKTAVHPAPGYFSHIKFTLGDYTDCGPGRLNPLTNNSITGNQCRRVVPALTYVTLFFSKSSCAIKTGCIHVTAVISIMMIYQVVVCQLNGIERMRSSTQGLLCQCPYKRLDKRHEQCCTDIFP